MKAFLTFTFLMALASNLLFAQNARFVTSGVVEFDKSINMHAMIKKNITKDNESYMNPAFEQFKKTQPQFKIIKSTLAFSKDKALFTPIAPEIAQSQNMFSSDPAAGQPNTIYTDLSTSSSICQKKIFEETFLVRDSVRKITWKITDETREIAGYACRRANAVIMDSIYVVAFYTDAIPVSGGPESFTGLPGMILGVALPHENTTWFATKVTDRALEAKEIIAPTKGKAVNTNGLIETLKSALKDWGEYAKTAFKVFLL